VSSLGTGVVYAADRKKVESGGGEIQIQIQIQIVQRRR